MLWDYRELYHSNISPAGEQSFFSPQICDASSTPIVLLWTGDCDLSRTGHMFTANHVVPIVKTEMMQYVEIISDSRTKKMNSYLGYGSRPSSTKCANSNLTPKPPEPPVNEPKAKKVRNK
ncbi:hypothetical protein DPMN_128847 [Dreissena polymorpha]|uniref:Uncharacterized protein n=1 Tax=Dreissena polymorpha TaxID=45954 RepID=A0A9D4H3P2_DREPO|nr:hypothetical protein DPMN_128847 [Dreissena polymorpha]